MIEMIGWPLLLAVLALVLLAVIAGAVLWTAVGSSRREIRAEDIDPEAFRD